MEVAAGVVDVGGDLGTKFFDGRKLDFRAQAAEEEQLDLRFRGQVEGMEVEQVSFNGERLGAECGALADIGYGIETLFGDTGAGNVNAIARHQFLIAAEVDGGNGVFSAIAAAAARSGDDTEGAAKQVAGIAEVALGGNQVAHAAAGNGVAADGHFRVNLHFETELAAEFGELLHVALGLASKAEVETFVDLAGMQLAMENFLGKLARGEQGKIAGERQEQNGV